MFNARGLLQRTRDAEKLWLSTVVNTSSKASNLRLTANPFTKCTYIDTLQFVVYL
jgi:hypothetical protein